MDGAAVISGERVVVRPVTLDDVDLLVRWHADPEVARFWDDKTYTREQMTARLARRQVAPYVVEAEGGPIGYLQTWVGDERGAAGIDMFLVSEARGRGLGPEAARLVAADLVSRGYERVTVDPYLWNEAAVRAWVRAGFRPVEARAADEEHTAPWLLMELEPLGD